MRWKQCFKKCAYISRLRLLLFFNIGDAVKTVPFTTKPDFFVELKVP